MVDRILYTSNVLDVLETLYGATTPLRGHQITTWSGCIPETTHDILRRLEKAGWITVTGADHHRPPNRIYELTPAGHREAARVFRYRPAVVQR